MNQIKVFSPATISNVACGFDVLGFPIYSIGDEMIVKKTKKKSLIITDITGYSVPYDINKNVSTIAAKAMIESLNPNCGFDFKINKKIIPGSGIGSSGSSAAASVYAINKLLDSPLNENELISFAMRGEVVSSISEHADNVSPAILGGIVMIKSLSPLEVIKLPTPKDLYCFVINPKIEIKTSFSRKILPNKVKLKNTTKQVSTFGSFIHALHTEDYELIGRSLNDYLIEKHRKKLIPLYDEVKSIAIKQGALGCSISGSGPSIFALTKGVEKANEINRLVTELYKTSGNDFSTYVSKISEKGVSTMSN
tara:strand:- start:12202 stop:13128 length:927 start_codon:yes stop_codon:yes gene_type:complete